MNLFKALKECINELEGIDLTVFYKALFSKKDELYMKEISKLCESNYFYIHFIKSNTDDKYDVGEIVISFDDETKYHECTYHIYLSYVMQDRHLPKVTVQKKQFLNGFIHIDEN